MTYPEVRVSFFYFHTKRENGHSLRRRRGQSTLYCVRKAGLGGRRWRYRPTLFFFFLYVKLIKYNNIISSKVTSVVHIILCWITWRVYFLFFYLKYVQQCGPPFDLPYYRKHIYHNISSYNCFNYLISLVSRVSAQTTRVLQSCLRKVLYTKIVMSRAVESRVENGKCLFVYRWIVDCKNKKDNRIALDDEHLE